jgi:hypothetical protein
MKRYLFVFFVLINCSEYGLCEEIQMDGWKKFKWGMTEMEVKQAEPTIEIGDSTKNDNFYFPFILKNIKIADKYFHAKLRFNKNSKKLDAVILFPVSDDDYSLFEKLYELLLAKYGKPTKIESSKFGSRDVLWIVDKTTISMHNLYGNTSSQGKINILFLKYEARFKADDNL